MTLINIAMAVRTDILVKDDESFLNTRFIKLLNILKV